MNLDVDLGDLGPVEWCAPCKAGDHEACTTSYPWHVDPDRKDPRWGRCGEFEDIWLQRFADHIGHGVLLRTRQPYSRTGIHLYWRGANYPFGWIVSVGEDEVGRYVEIETAGLDLNRETHPFFMEVIPDAEHVRFYIGAVLGAKIYRQMRGQDSPFGRNWGDVLEEWEKSSPPNP